jgi:hypothetical protein
MESEAQFNLELKREKKSNEFDFLPKFGYG